MKGTLDATLPDAAGRLLADEKETAEHATIVDLIRNDLSQIATEVCVPRYRYLETLQTHCGPLLQMSSEVRGRLPETIWSIWELSSSVCFLRDRLPGRLKRKRWT